MTKWWYRLAKRFYAIPDRTIRSGCDLVVAIEYGITKNNDLPDATVKVIEEAKRIAHIYRAPIIWASNDYFWPDSDEFIDSLKLKLFPSPFDPRVIMAGGVDNSVNEARKIKEAIIEKNLPLPNKNIVVVCEWAHGRSVRFIWKRVFPASRILIRSVEAKWDKSHRIRACQSYFWWLIADIARHLALLVFGLDWVAKIHQPVEK